jgi:outer membrane protein assembly factor BamA
VLFLEQIATLDLRDDSRNPTEGAFFSIGMQEAGLVAPGISSWDYVRVLAEARGYVPLGLGIVLAMRFGVGAMFIIDAAEGVGGAETDDDDLCPPPGGGRANIYDLDELGPLSQQLQGGGSISNRGFPPGLMGNVCRRQIEVRPRYGDGVPSPREAIISGGNYRWEASIEFRFPITTELGVTLFTDAGDVSRVTVDFAALNLAFGLGIRYRTIVGPFRFDIAYRPDQLAYIGDDPRTFCRGENAGQNNGCTPYPEIFGAFPGAVHLTIGEAF